MQEIENERNHVYRRLSGYFYSLNSDYNLFWPDCLKAFEDFSLENKRKAATGEKTKHAVCFKHPRELVLARLSIKAAAGMGTISVNLPISSWIYMIDVLMIS